MTSRRAPPLALALALIGAVAVDARAQQEAAEVGPPADSAAVQDTVAPDTAGPTFRLPPPWLSVAVGLGTTNGGEAQSLSVLARERKCRECRLSAPWLGPGAAAADSSLITGTYTLRSRLTAGISAALGLSPAWALTAGVAWGTGTLSAEYDGENEAMVDRAASVARELELRVLTLESGLRYRIASERRLQPYIELGIILSRWERRGGGLFSSGSAAGAFTGGLDRVEGIAGVGGAVPLTDRLAVRIAASTRVFRTPLAPAAVGDTVGIRPDLVLLARATPDGRFADRPRELVGLYRVDIGLSLDLRRSAGPSEGSDPDAASEPSSPPGRRLDP